MAMWFRRVFDTACRECYQQFISLKRWKSEKPSTFGCPMCRIASKWKYMKIEMKKEKKLESERSNPLFKPRLNILLHTQYKVNV